MNALAANFAALGDYLAAATMVVAINGWSVVAMSEQDTGLCLAYLNHPTLSDPRSGQPFRDSLEVRSYALSRGYLRWYRPGERDAAAVGTVRP